MNETRNNYNQVAKKQGTTYTNMDLADVIYNSQHVDPATFFVDKDGSEFLCTVLAIVHK